MSSQDSAKNSLFERFVQLFRKLRRGDCEESIAWSLETSEPNIGVEICDECKDSPDYICDTQSVECISCSSRNIVCSRYTGFLKQTIMRELGISERIYSALVKQYGDSAKGIHPQASTYNREDGMDTDECAATKELLPSSSSIGLSSANYNADEPLLPYAHQNEEDHTTITGHLEDDVLVSDLRSAHVRLSLRFQADNKRMEDMLHQVSETQRQCTELLEQVEVMRSALNAKEQQLTVAQRCLEEQKKNTEGADLLIAEKDKNLDEARRHCKELQRKINDLEAKLGPYPDRQERCNELQRSVEILGTALGAKNQQLAEYQTSYGELQKRCEKVEAELSKRDNLMFEVRERCKELENELAVRKRRSPPIIPRQPPLSPSVQERLQFDLTKRFGWKSLPQQQQVGDISEDRFTELISTVTQNHGELLDNFSKISEELGQLSLGLNGADGPPKSSRGTKRKRGDVIDLTEPYDSDWDGEFQLKTEYVEGNRSGSLRRKGKERM